MYNMTNNAVHKRLSRAGEKITRYKKGNMFLFQPDQIQAVFGLPNTINTPKTPDLPPKTPPLSPDSILAEQIKGLEAQIQLYKAQIDLLQNQVEYERQERHHLLDIIKFVATVKTTYPDR